MCLGVLLLCRLVFEVRVTAKRVQFTFAHRVDIEERFQITLEAISTLGFEWEMGQLKYTYVYLDD